MKYEDTVGRLRTRVARGLSLEEAILLLHDEGLTITQSMKAIVEVFGLSLATAKAMVCDHPCWASVVKAAESLHDELEELANDDEP